MGDTSDHPAWQPGWQTAEEAAAEWHQQHGWAAEPPPDIKAEWAEIRRAEIDYRRSLKPACTLGSTVPATLYLPAHPKMIEPAGNIEIELYTLSDGRCAIYAFTSTRKLVEALGRHQPWVQLNGPTVAAMSGGILIVDPPPARTTKNWTEERLRSLVEATK